MKSEAPSTNHRMLEKIRALLAKAESTTFPAEAEAFTAKAQELMAAYSIDAALVRAQGVRSGKEKPDTTAIRVDAPYASQKASLLHHIARANFSKAIWSKEGGYSNVVGFASDLELVELLYTSLLVQANNAMMSEESSDKSFRTSFLQAFAQRVGGRLQEAKKPVQQDADESTALVLVSQQQAVDDAYALAFPYARKSRGTISNPHGWRAGVDAANKAHLKAPGQIKAS